MEFGFKVEPGVKVNPGSTLRGTSAFVAVSVLAMCALAPQAVASPETDLASAQSTANQAEEQIGISTTAQQTTQAQLAKVAPKAAAANERAAAALAQVQQLEENITAERTAAAEEIASDEDRFDEDEQKYEEERAGIGLGLGAGLLCLVPFLWSRFRSLRIVSWLADLTLLQAMGVVVGGGLAITLAGGGLLESDSGWVKAIGGLLLTLGIGIPVALAAARHSVRVQLGDTQPLFSRERLPRWLALIFGILLALLAVGGLGAGISADAPDEVVATAEQRELADAAEGDPLDPVPAELLAAREAATPLQAAAAQLEQKRQQSQTALAESTRTLKAARRQLAQAENAIASATNRIARRQAAAAPAPPVSSGGGSSGGSPTSCDSAPSNIPVPPGSPLDGDGDGIGCEE